MKWVAAFCARGTAIRCCERSAAVGVDLTCGILKKSLRDRGTLPFMRFLKILCLLATCTGPAVAQTEQPGVFHETATGLTMRFPVELVVRDAQKAIDEGHVAVFGSMQNEAKEHELAGRCMKPILLAELPDGSPQGNQ